MHVQASMDRCFYFDSFCTQKAACFPPFSALCPRREVYLGGPSVLTSSFLPFSSCQCRQSPLHEVSATAYALVLISLGARVRVPRAQTQG